MDSIFQRDSVPRRAAMAQLRAAVVLPTALVTAAIAVFACVGPVRAATSGPISLQSGTLTVSLAPHVYAKLTRSTHGSYPDTRSLTATGAAIDAGGGVFSFALTHGRLDPVALTGSAASGGGVRFDSVSQNTAAGESSTVQFSLSGFALDFSSTPAALTATFKGKSTYHNIPIASLVTTAVHTRTHGRNLTLTGLGLKLLASGAQLFNQQAYNNQSHGFKVGQSIGTATLTAVS